LCGDATNLQQIATASFDAAVFSLNGIDSIRTDSDRSRCFQEIARVLRPGGYFIFSSHNARSIGFEANLRKYLLDRARSNSTVDVASQARSLASEAGRWGLVRKLARSIRISAQFFLRKLLVADIYKGTGYYFDHSHGGLILFASTPECIAAESRIAGFDVVEVVSNVYPNDGPDYVKQWYYYAVRAGQKP
jgi:SAM-dependent methyltransferase